MDQFDIRNLSVHVGSYVTDLRLDESGHSLVFGAGQHGSETPPHFRFSRHNVGASARFEHGRFQGRGLDRIETAGNKGR